MDILRLPDQDQFIHQVKIRIGEPITAIDTNFELVAFGSISGYFGVHSLEAKQTKYVPEVYEELIRGVYLRSKTQALISVGDVNAVLVDLQNVTDKYRHNKYLFQNHIEKDQARCASTISFQRQDKVVLITCSPTQNKDAIIDITNLKQYFHIFDYSKVGSLNQDVIVLEELQNLKVPEIYVPHDYDSDSVVMLEYQKDGKKAIKIIELQDQDGESTPVTWENSLKVEFVSFIRRRQNFIIYITNHQAVHVYDLASKTGKEIYAHSATIQAIDVSLKGKVDPEKGTVELSDLIISTLDYDLQYTLFSGGKVYKKVDLYRLAEKQNEMVRQHRYIFDMGYPYYLRYNKGVLAFSSDIGILIYRINLD